MIIGGWSGFSSSCAGPCLLASPSCLSPQNVYARMYSPEGDLIRVRNEATARKEQLELEAQGEALATKMKAEAQAQAIQVVGDAIEKYGTVPSQLDVAKQYVEMYGEMGQTSNTMIFSDKPADINSLMAQAATVFNSVGDNSKPASGTIGEER